MVFDAAVPPDFDSMLTGANRAAVEISAVAEIPKIRFDSLKEAAVGYGIRSGLARRTYEINKVLVDNKNLLDAVFNFNALLLDRNVLPPVLSEATNTLRQPDSETIRIADATFRIERQAAFVTATPTWREYLIRDVKYKPETVSEIMVPKNDAEKRVWQQFVTQGWGTGVHQAEAIFEQSLSRLERDVHGMILYRTLLARGMISRPYVAESNLGVTGDGNAMTINDRILRITAKPQLQPKAQIWKPITIPKESAK